LVREDLIGGRPAEERAELGPAVALHDVELEELGRLVREVAADALGVLPVDAAEAVALDAVGAEVRGAEEATDLLVLLRRRREGGRERVTACPVVEAARGPALFVAAREDELRVRVPLLELRVVRRDGDVGDAVERAQEREVERAGLE